MRETEAEDWGGRDKSRIEVLLLTFTIEVTRWRKSNHTPMEQGGKLVELRDGDQQLLQPGGVAGRPQVEIWESCACLPEV